MRNTTKSWYTLVELIVVLSILSILATLWFLTYTSHLAWARDTQRHSDLSVLTNSIKNIFVRWFNPSVLVNTWTVDRTWSWAWNFYTAWKSLVWEINYKAWWINYDYLTDLNKEMLDPKNQKSYIIWVFENNYELATTMEDSDYAYIVRSNRPRTSSWTLSELDSTDDTRNIITLKNEEDSIKFTIWDEISNGSTWTWIIVDMVRGTLYVSDSSWFAWWESIRLFKDDTSLIWNIWSWNGSLTACNSIVANMAENECPIKELNKVLVPYQFN